MIVIGINAQFIKQRQSSVSVLIEAGIDEYDFLFFDIGSGALKNFNGLKLPVAATTKVFLTHLHADHVGDMPTLIWSLAKSGRSAPVEVWGPAGETERLGTLAYTQHLEAAHAWDTETMKGHPGEAGARRVTTEIPYDRPIVVYERNGVRISSFLVVHSIKGAIGYRLDYKGIFVVFFRRYTPMRIAGRGMQEWCRPSYSRILFFSRCFFQKKLVFQSSMRK